MSRSAAAWKWTLWAAGAALFPCGALLVPRGASPVGLANFLAGAPGIALWAVWAVGIALMVCAMRMLRGTPLRTVVVAQFLASVAVAALTTTTPSTDPYLYVELGHIQATGGDPWGLPFRAQSPETVAAFYADATASRSSVPPMPSSYGPAFVGFEAALSRLEPSASFAAWVYVHRALSLAAAVAISCLIRGPRIAYWGLNPLVIVEFAIAGHNDALMLLLVALAMRVRSSLGAGLLVGIAGMVKIPALATAAFIRRPLLTIAGAGCAVLVLIAAFPRALTATAFAGQAQIRANSLAVGLASLLSRLRCPHADVVSPLLILAAIVLAVRLSGRRWSRRNGPAAASLALLAITPYLQSWYLTWPLFCAPWISRKLRILVVAAAALGWLFDIETISLTPPHFVALAFWLPLLALGLWLYIKPLPTPKPRGRAEPL